MSVSSEKPTWKILSERGILTSPFMSLYEQNCERSDGAQQHKFYVLRSRDWCNVIPVTSTGNIVLVRQYRHGAAVECFEIPGGVVDPEDSQIAKAALRELKEETGYEPLPQARIVDLGSTYSNPAILNNRTHSFIVGPVQKISTQSLDPGEIIEVLEVPIDEVVSMLTDGRMDHALIMNAFFKLQLKGVPLAEALRRFQK
mgnify:CR=1 FL=1